MLLPWLPAAPWVPGSLKVMNGGMPAVDNNCKLMCTWGGVIQVLNKKSGPFTDHDAVILAALATQAAISIDNSRLFLSVTQKNTELLETHEQLEHRVRDLKLLFDLESAMGRSQSLEELFMAVIDYRKAQNSRPRTQLDVDMLRSTPYIGGLLVLRRGLFAELGGFDPARDGTEEYDLALRLAEKIEAEIVKAEQKLANPSFVQKVPPQVLVEHQQRALDLKAKLDQIIEALKALEG